MVPARGAGGDLGQQLIELRRSGCGLVCLAQPVAQEVGLPRAAQGLQRGNARRQAYATLARNIGVPYDFAFEVATTDKLACTELVNLAMPGLEFTTREAYGREVIFPDEVVAQAIRGESMRVVGYMVGTDGGFAWRNTQSLMADIAAYWGVPGAPS